MGQATPPGRPWHGPQCRHSVEDHGMPAAIFFHNLGVPAILSGTLDGLAIQDL